MNVADFGCAAETGKDPDTSKEFPHKTQKMIPNRLPIPFKYSPEQLPKIQDNTVTNIQDNQTLRITK